MKYIIFKSLISCFYQRPLKTDAICIVEPHLSSELSAKDTGMTSKYAKYV